MPGEAQILKVLWHEASWLAPPFSMRLPVSSFSLHQAFSQGLGGSSFGSAYLSDFGRSGQFPSIDESSFPPFPLPPSGLRPILIFSRPQLLFWVSLRCFKPGKFGREGGRTRGRGKFPLSPCVIFRVPFGSEFRRDFGFWETGFSWVALSFWPWWILPFWPIRWRFDP